MPQRRRLPEPPRRRRWVASRQPAAAGRATVLRAGRRFAGRRFAGGGGRLGARVVEYAEGVLRENERER